MKYTYEELEKDVLIQIDLYKEMRKSDPWNYQTLKSISDELSEALVFFGPVAASLRANAERAKANREHYFEERRIYWHKKLGGERGNATIITANATIDCRDIKMKEIDANEAYYKAKEIIDRIDQELNSISRRFKECKHD